VRVHDASENACPSFAEMVSLIQSYLTKVQRRYKNLSSEQKDLFHISINELNYLAARYIEKMESSNLGTQEDIISLFRRSNLIIDSEKSSTADVEGEILPTKYYRIVAIKDK
jgi:hypothetical protein